MKRRNWASVAREFRDKTAICGVALTLGKFPERTPLSLAIEAFKLALDDSGLEREDVDGLIVLSFRSDYDRFLEAVGLNMRYAHQGWTHGRFMSPTVQLAAMAVGMAMAKAVAIVNGKRGKAFGAPTDTEMWRQGLGPRGEVPLTARRLAAQRSGTYNLKQAERPPSAGITAPVTVRDSFDARNTAMAAISSDSATENGNQLARRRHARLHRSGRLAAGTRRAGACPCPHPADG